MHFDLIGLTVNIITVSDSGGDGYCWDWLSTLYASHQGRSAMTAWRWVEKSLLVVGILLVGIFVGASLQGKILSRLALWKFEIAHSAKAVSSSMGAARPGDEVDFSLWSRKRIQAYKESLASKLDAPLGVLRIPKLRLVVPVFEGTDDLTLNRGVGRIAGTAELGDDGNVGIAGHRDGFFRVLKDIEMGDSIELEVDDRALAYVVQSLEIVYPNNTDVLHSKDTNQSELTLVTCYPFYFVGSAPQRFIVHATLTKDSPIDGYRAATKR